jgi:hypothetical protein
VSVYFPQGALIATKLPPSLDKAASGAMVAVNFPSGSCAQDQAIIGWFENQNNYALFRTQNANGGCRLHYTRKVAGVVRADNTTTYQYQEGVRSWIGYRTNPLGMVTIFRVVGGQVSSETFQSPGGWSDFPRGTTSRLVVGDAPIGLDPLAGGLQAVTAYGFIPNDGQLSADKVELESYMSGSI